MLCYYPSYYSEFSCLASDCPDTCCAQWEINIDDLTFEKYHSINEDFAELIKIKINCNESGELCFKLENGNCPFLNDKKLCKIHIACGEEYTPEVCRQHPRFVEEYDGFTEISLSLSCPAAVSLVISDSDIISYPKPVYDGDDEILQLLINSRSHILETIDVDFSAIQKTLLDTAADDLLDIDLVYVQEHTCIDVPMLKDYLQILSGNCEILTAGWKALLIKTAESNITELQLSEYIHSINKNMFDVCRYLVYRYYLKAINGIDIYSVALFIVFSCRLCAMISLSCSVDFNEVCRLFSKEIEHFPENINLLFDYLDNI